MIYFFKKFVIFGDLSSNSSKVTEQTRCETHICQMALNGKVTYTEGDKQIYVCNILLTHCGPVTPYSITELGITPLTHWGRVTHICVGKLTIIDSDNGLSPVWRQAIIWTNAGILLIGPLGTKFSEILIAIHTFSFKKMHPKLSSAKCRPFCLGLNVLTEAMLTNHQWGLVAFTQAPFHRKSPKYLSLIWVWKWLI